MTVSNASFSNVRAMWIRVLCSLHVALSPRDERKKLL